MTDGERAVCSACGERVVSATQVVRERDGGICHRYCPAPPEAVIDHKAQAATPTEIAQRLLREGLADCDHVRHTCEEIGCCGAVIRLAASIDAALSAARADERVYLLALQALAQELSDGLAHYDRIGCKWTEYERKGYELAGEVLAALRARGQEGA